MLKLGTLRARRCIRAAPMLVLALAMSAGASAADAVLYRIFLRDGSTVVSYGEFARVADRVVFMADGQRSRCAVAAAREHSRGDRRLGEDGALRRRLPGPALCGARVRGRFHLLEQRGGARPHGVALTDDRPRGGARRLRTQTARAMAVGKLWIPRV